MRYFVTGATGFIGTRLVHALLARRGSKVYCLLRPGSAAKLNALRAAAGVSKTRLIAIGGDLRSEGLGVSAECRKLLQGHIDAVYHLGAIYDLQADAASQLEVNVKGTQRLVEFAAAIGAKHLHHVSSIAAAGLFEGVFRENMFEQAEGLEHPYFSSKHASEKIVRERCTLPWTIYRPAMVVGDSRTGEIDKVDGPYHLFKTIQRLRQLLPPWLPAVGLEGGRVNLVPVDFVVRCLDHISHLDGDIAGRCFHLVDKQDHRVSELMNIFSQAAHGPKLRLTLSHSMLSALPAGIGQSLLQLEPLRRVRDAVMQDLGLPEQIFTFLNWPTRYDRRELDGVLQGSGIECPPLKRYAWVLWDYWERHLDPALLEDHSLAGAVEGKVVLITGGSSGIGLASACRFAQAGAITVICARDQAQLAAAVKQIKASVKTHAEPPEPGQSTKAKAKGKGKGNGKGKGSRQPQVFAYSADIASESDCQTLVQTLQDKHGGVDLLINNAGRSIRRAIESSYDRFHDYERTMQLNYFGCLRITLGLLPGMVARGGGHVVNLSSIGVLVNAPRFSAYVASKAALDAWTRCAASEFADRGISFTTVHMPLVRTPMIAPTRIYDSTPMLSPEEAAEMVVQACIEKPSRVATPLGVLGEVLYAAAPKLSRAIMNATFRMFPESAAAASNHSGRQEQAKELSAQALAISRMMKGIHF